MSTVLRPLDQPAIRSYLNDVIAWHGFVRFLGLPTFQDKTDVAIGELFVAPALSSQPISADSSPAAWPSTESAIDVLTRERRIVVLGDPGSGKSTLINWLAWRLSAGLTTRMPEWFENLLPLPLILRELDLSRIETFDDLLKAFLRRPVAESIKKVSEIIPYLEQGRALLLLDGLDEIPLRTRQRLQKAVWQGWQRYPDLYSIATSRVIGYEECAFDSDIVKRAAAGTTTKDVSRPVDVDELPPHAIEALAGARRASLVYVAPFDDQRIEVFASNWYRARLASEKEAKEQARRFIGALRSGTGTWQLARTPNLLTIMALVFRIRVQLPDGRGLLYEHIAQAYLESIDQSRGLPKDPYPWQEKRRWLARVGFEMQYSRQANDDKTLLAAEKSILTWISNAMRDSGYPSDTDFAQEYLKSIARRSGLLLPRGEGQFAFLHLSFQEYFAAVYLLEQIQDPDWAALPASGPTKESPLDSRISKSSLQEWAASSLWRETLVFCFELLGQEPRWAGKLAEWTFGPDFRQAKWRSDDHLVLQGAGVTLLARLVVDPHSGLPAPVREKAWRKCWDFVVDAGLVGVQKDTVDLGGLLEGNPLAVLCSAETWRQRTVDEVAKLKPTFLNLSGCGITDLGPWVDASPELESLIAWNSAATGLSPLRRLKRIKALLIDVSHATDYSALKGLRTLTALGLTGLNASDLEVLPPLDGVANLQLISSAVSLDGISRFPNVKTLYLMDTRVADLSPLIDLANLERLYLFRVPTLDLTPLTKLPNLRQLYIEGQHHHLGLLRDRGVKIVGPFVDSR